MTVMAVGSVVVGMDSGRVKICVSFFAAPALALVATVSSCPLAAKTHCMMELEFFLNWSPPGAQPLPLPALPT
jgi:hypothetical protein